MQRRSGLTTEQHFFLPPFPFNSGSNFLVDIVCGTLNVNYGVS